MRTEDIPSILKKFIKNKDHKNILINGPWGIGKTKYITEFSDENVEVYYSSLFGKMSNEEIISELYYKIIRDSKFGPIKEYVGKRAQTLGPIDISVFGIGTSFSLPIIIELENALKKALEKKGKFLIIFDDLERKHDNLHLKEIFGLIDRLSLINNVKIVTIAATNKIIEDDKLVFDDYKEKIVDREYIIQNYAISAPEEILTTAIWEDVKDIISSQDIYNLRTITKSKFFIDEVESYMNLNELSFSENLSKKEIHRMCVSIVIFVTHLNKNMKDLPKDTTDTRQETYIKVNYTENPSGYSNYINKYILGNTGHSPLSRNLISPLLHFYESGEWLITINELIIAISKFRKKHDPFYLSSDQIKDFIDNNITNIKQFEDYSNLKSLLLEINSAMQWAETLDALYPLSNQQILNKINNQLRIDLSKSLHLNKIEIFMFGQTTLLFNNLIENLNILIRDRYVSELFTIIKHNLDNHIYDLDNIKQLPTLLYPYDSTPKIFAEIIKNNFFLPLPKGNISEEQWQWCNIMREFVYFHCKNKEITKKYEDFIGREKEKTKDPLFKYRLDLLLERMEF